MVPLDSSLADERTREGMALCEDVKRKFAGKYAQTSEGLRILIHLLPLERSPGGHSLFRNLAESLQYIGIPTRCATWADPLTEILRTFKPSILLTSDSPEYLGRIDWRAFSAYRSVQSCRLGLTASIQEYGNTPLPGRLRWAAEHGVDFTVSGPRAISVNGPPTDRFLKRASRFFRWSSAPIHCSINLLPGLSAISIMSFLRQVTTINLPDITNIFRVFSPRIQDLSMVLVGGIRAP